MTAIETEEHKALRAAVAALGKRYGRAYLATVTREGGHPNELWAEAAKLGYLGVNLPEEYGGGGGGIAELSIVLEELGAAGCPLLMMIVSPAICGTVIARFGTEEQKQDWLPGLADGTRTMAFGITEPDAGSNSPPHHHHRPPRRTRRLDAHRPQGLHLRRRHRRRHPHRRPHRGRPDGQAQALPVHRPARRRGLHPAPDRHGTPGRRRSSSSWSSTTYGCPPTHSSATRTRACSSSSPGSTPSAS